MNRRCLLEIVAIAALTGCGVGATGGREVTLKEGVRGCTTLADAVKFEEIEHARDWQASMDMLRSGRCTFATPGDTIVIENVSLDGSTQFHERGKDGSLWTKETIKPAGGSTTIPERKR